MSKLLVPARAARDAIGVKNTKFYQLLSDGKLDARKLGSRTFITVESIRAFVDNLPRADIHLAPRKIAVSGNGRGDSGASSNQASENKRLVADITSSKTEGR